MKLRRFVGFYIDVLIMTLLIKTLTRTMSNDALDLGDSSFSISPSSFQFSSFAPVRFEFFSIVRFGMVTLVAMFRDGFNGRGPGKWVAGTQVVSEVGAPITYLDSFKRNASLLLWPVEAISILFTGVRITDKIFHYKVIKNDKMYWPLRVLFSMGITIALFFILNRINLPKS